MKKTYNWLKVGFTASCLMLSPLCFCINQGIMVVNPSLGIALAVAS